MPQKYHILKQYANGVMDEKGRFYPFKCDGGSGLDLAAKVGVRYFIHTVTLSHSKAGASAGSSADVSGTIKKVSVKLAYLAIPETFAASNDVSTCTFVLDCLMDVGTAVNCGTGIATYSYAEVDEQEGEYSG